MNLLLENLLTASFHGSIVILAVILARLILRRTPKKYICLIWLLAFVRLLMPFEIQSNLSIQPAFNPFSSYEQVQQRQQPLPEPVPAVPQDAVLPPDTEVVYSDAFTPPESIPEGLESYYPPVQNEVHMVIDCYRIAGYAWVAIAAGVVVLSMISYMKLKYRVREAIHTREGAWECAGLDTAFILGFLRPRIYLPMGVADDTRAHILHHERTHLKRGDHWLKLLAFLALSLHWFNPLVWAAWMLLCRDMELACDEQVVQDMTLEERKNYSAALLHCSAGKNRYMVCPVAFGEMCVKERILSVLNYRKPGFWISLAGAIAIVLVAVFLMTSPGEERNHAQIPELGYTESAYSRRVSEPYNPSITFDSKTMDYESDWASYYFDGAVPEKTRDAYVFYSDAIVKRFEFEEKPDIVVLHEYEGAWVSDNTLYIGGAPDTVDYGAQLISLLCGGYANYGAAYGYADFIAVEEGWKEQEENLPDLTDSAARDLNWLCFREGFVSDREIGVNKAIAACFARDFIAANGEEEFRKLIAASGATESVDVFCGILADWYFAQGIDYLPSNILYAIGGSYHDYLVKCPYAEFVLPMQWDNGWDSDLTGDPGFLHGSYEETKYCFETNIYQMECLREYIGFDNYKDSLTVEFSVRNDVSNTDMYEQRIELRSIEDLPILYVYWLADWSLRDPAQRNYPMYCGMAHHISLNCPNVYKEEMLQFMAQNGWTPELYLQGDWNELYVQMLEGVEDPYTIQKTRFDFGAYYFDDYYTDPGMGMYTSFPWYLIDKYGYETMFDYVYETGNTPIELDMAGEKKEWIDWIEKTYGEYPKYSDYLAEQEPTVPYVCWDLSCTDQHHDHSGRDCTVSGCTDPNHHHEESCTVSGCEDSSHGHHHHEH